MLVRPLKTNLKMTDRDDCAVSACSLPLSPLHPPCFLPMKALVPLVASGRGIGRWTGFLDPPPPSC